MESQSFITKADEFKNNQIKECPYCNAIVPLSEYDDHMFCHQIDGQENGQQGFNINNYGIQINSCNNNNSNSINSINNNNNVMNINSNINSNNINSNNSLMNNNNNNNNHNNDNNYSLFQDNNISQPYINPVSQQINSINVINDNNNQNNQINQISHINHNNQNNQNNNPNFNSNNNINNNNKNNNIPNSNEGSFIDKIKNYFIPQIKNTINSNNNNQNNNVRDIMNIPIEQLSPDERAERNRIEEQRAYEKKILGIANSESKIQAEDSRSNGEKITDFIQNNSNAILATIDIIGCLTLHTPSIARTVSRVANFVGEQYSNYMNSNNSSGNNVNDVESNDYNNIIRQHPELKKKDKDVDTIIKFLPVSEIKEIKLNPDNNNNNTKCIICLSEFEIGDQVSALPCAHVFHSECIASWLKKHCQCPVCKFDITLKSLIGAI